MLRNGYGAVASLALVASLMLGGAASAGEECCGSKDAAAKKEAAAAKDAGCCEGEKSAAAKDASCDLGACDAEHAAGLDGILAKIGAPAPKLSAEDEKVVADAKAALMSCPAGRALTAALPAVCDALCAVGALDEALAKQNGLPEDCRGPDGWCAFCSEAGKDAPEAAKKAMKVSMSSIARAKKLACALLPIAASVPLKGETTQPAGCCASEFPGEARLLELSGKVDAAAKELRAGFDAAKKSGEAERKKIHDAVATLDRLYPAHSPVTLARAHMALYREAGLASEATVAFGKLCPKMNDAQLVSGLSKNAQNAHKLLSARSKLIAALGAAHDVVKADACVGEAEGHGAAKPVPEKKGEGCCEGAKASN
jgi:hypothetical protein